MAKAEPNPTTRGLPGLGIARQSLATAAAARAAHPRASAGSPQSALRPGSVSVGASSDSGTAANGKTRYFKSRSGKF